jgi:hypothetical protein
MTSILPNRQEILAGTYGRTFREIAQTNTMTQYLASTQTNRFVTQFRSQREIDTRTKGPNFLHVACILALHPEACVQIVDGTGKHWTDVAHLTDKVVNKASEIYWAEILEKNCINQVTAVNYLRGQWREQSEPYDYLINIHRAPRIKLEHKYCRTRIYMPLTEMNSAHYAVIHFAEYDMKTRNESTTRTIQFNKRNYEDGTPTEMFGGITNIPHDGGIYIIPMARIKDQYEQRHHETQYIDLSITYNWGMRMDPTKAVAFNTRKMQHATGRAYRRERLYNDTLEVMRMNQEHRRRSRSRTPPRAFGRDVGTVDIPSQPDPKRFKRS